MTIFARTVAADNVGTTADTFEAVGTVTLNNVAKRVLGIIAIAVSSGTMTTAEALMGSFRITADDLGITNMELGADLAVGGGPATNEQGVVLTPKLRSLRYPRKGFNSGADIDGIDIDIEYSANLPEPTSDAAGQLTVIYDDGKTPGDILDKWPHMINDINWWGRANDDEIGDATSETMDDTISVPKWVTEIVGMDAHVAPDTVLTAGEFFLGYIEFTSTLGTTFAPQEWPVPAINACLGTPVGIPVTQYPSPSIPMHISGFGKKKETITPTAKLLNVTSGANALSCTLYGR